MLGGVSNERIINVINGKSITKPSRPDDVQCPRIGYVPYFWKSGKMKVCKHINDVVRLEK